MGSHSIGHDSFEHPRVGTVRVSTIAFDEPQEYGASLHGATYQAETIVFVGPYLEARIGGLLRYRDVDLARRRHVGIVNRARRGHRRGR